MYSREYESREGAAGGGGRSVGGCVCFHFTTHQHLQTFRKNMRQRTKSPRQERTADGWRMNCAEVCTFVGSDCPCERRGAPLCTCEPMDHRGSDAAARICCREMTGAHLSRRDVYAWRENDAMGGAAMNQERDELRGWSPSARGAGSGVREMRHEPSAVASMAYRRVHFMQHTVPRMGTPKRCWHCLRFNHTKTPPANVTRARMAILNINPV